MSQRVSIHGPNIGHGGEFHVHKDFCADTKRGEYLYADTPWRFTATSKQQVVEEIYSDILPENPDATWETYADTVRFFPCVNVPTYGTEIPDTPFYRQMAEGHAARCGHALTGHLTSPDGKVYTLVRTCCEVAA